MLWPSLTYGYVCCDADVVPTKSPRYGALEFKHSITLFLGAARFTFRLQAPPPNTSCPREAPGTKPSTNATHMGDTSADPRRVLSHWQKAKRYSGGPHIRFPFWGGRVPLDLRFRGPLEAKSFVRGRKIDPPGASGRVLDLKCASCGHVRRCISG